MRQEATKLDVLVGLMSPSTLRKALAEYEATGDHDHGRGPIKPGAPCPGGDCWVARARKLLATLEDNQKSYF